MSVTGWVGVAPRSWPLLRIKHVCKSMGGGTPDKGKPEYWQGEIPWVSPKDMKSSRIVDTEDHITAEGLASSAARLVPPSAVLIVMRSGILRHSIPVAINEVPIALNQDMRALIPDERLAPEFLACLIEGHQAELLKAWSKVGATVESLESDLLGDTLIPVPPRPVQSTIIHYVGRVRMKLDGLLIAKQRLLDLVAEKRKAVIATAVTRGLDPKVKLRDSGVPWLGEIPAHWGLKRMKYLFRLVADKAPADNDYELLSLYTDIGVKPRRELEARGNKASSTDEYWMVQPGDLVINKLLAWMGAFGVSEYHGVTSPAYDILRPQAGVEPFYFHHLFRCGVATTEVRARSYGIMDMRLRLYFDRLGDMYVPHPTLKEQQAIVDHIARETAKLDKVRAATERTIGLLKERRAALIAAAVTGQIDVNAGGPDAH